MSIEYYILAASSNLKGDDDHVLYYVEPSEGGGIEFTGTSIQEAIDWIHSVGGVLSTIE